MLDCNSFFYQLNHLKGSRLMKNIVKKATCKWACTIIFKQLQHSGTLPTSFKYAYISFKTQSYKTPVKKDLMGIISSRTNERLKVCIILWIFCVLIIFYTYQNIHSFSNKFKSIPSKFCKCFYYNSEDKALFQVFYSMRMIVNVYIES